MPIEDGKKVFPNGSIKPLFLKPNLKLEQLVSFDSIKKMKQLLILQTTSHAKPKQ